MIVTKYFYSYQAYDKDGALALSGYGTTQESDLVVVKTTLLNSISSSLEINSIVFVAFNPIEFE